MSYADNCTREEAYALAKKHLDYARSFPGWWQTATMTTFPSAYRCTAVQSSIYSCRFAYAGTNKNDWDYFFTSECPAGKAWDADTHTCVDPAVDPPKNLGPGCLEGCGNPINTATGNKYQREDDFHISSLLAFSRHYNSHPTVKPDLLGPRWTHTYARAVAYSGAGTENQIAVVSRPQGNRVTFRYTSGQWQPDADAAATLVRHDGSQGELLGWTYTQQDGHEVEEYDTLGRLMQVTTTDGGTITLTYNNGLIENNANDFRLTRVLDRDGRSLVFDYDSSARISKITTPAGSEYVYAYDATGRLETVTYPGGAQRRYHYNESINTDGANLPFVLTGITHEDNQRFATFTYAASGHATSTQHADAVDKFSIQYNADGSASITGPLGETQQREFATVLGVRKATSVVEQCAGCTTRTTSYTYDANGHRDVTTDPRGITTDYDYSSRRLLVNKIEAANDATGKKRTTQTDWHATLAVPTERRTYDAANTLVAKSTWTYNARGQALTSSQIDPATGTTRTSTTTYCEQPGIDAGTCPLLGLVIASDGPRTDANDVTTYTYYPSDDAACATAPTTCPHRKGDLWRVTNALGQVTETLKYDGAGRVLSVKDASGVITDLEYHPRGWLAARKVRGTDGASETDDQITRIDYYPTGLVQKTTLPDGSYTAYTYDAAHRLTDIADGEGNKLHYTLDNAGNRTKEDTLGHTGDVLRTLSRVYNQLGQLQTQKDAYDHATGFAYDANGNTDTVTDALSRVTDNDYDPLDRLTQTIQNVGGLNVTTEFQYDARDNLTAVVDPKGLTTGYTYNGLGDLTQLSSPDTGITTYTYDSGGNRKTQTDARGVTTTYGYDALNRLISIRYPDSSLDQDYYYDEPIVTCPTGEQFQGGRLGKIRTVSGSVILRYCYDRFGNVTRKIQNTNGKVFTQYYTYTQGGQLSSTRYNDGTLVDYVRDGLGRVTEVGVSRAGAGIREVLLHGATYYPFGPPAEWTWGNGSVFRRSLNQNYQPGFIEGIGVSFGYEFDAVGNLYKQRNATQADPPNRVYGYDPLNRLAEVRDGAGVLRESYGYDATGNRTVATDNGITQAYSYPTGSHRLDAVGAIGRNYDAVGNTTAINGTEREFVYNDAGRMSQVKRTGAVAMNYEYNGKGEQIRRYLGATSSHFMYDEAGHWLGEYDSAGAPTQQVIWLDDLPVGVVAGNKLHYIAADALGSPRAVYDPQRSKELWRWALGGEAFGVDVPGEDMDADGIPFVFNLRFPGQRYDAASGLNQNGFRDYEAATGRYPQPDPIGLSGGVSAYAYVDSNPLIYTDYLGLAKDQACVAAATTAGAVCGGAIGYYGGGVVGGLAGGAVCSPSGPGAAVCAAGGAAGGSTGGGALGSAIGGALGNLAGQVNCPDEKSCPPCRTLDGRTVPVGTIGYRLDIVPPGKPHYPYKGSHYNLYKANQNPNNCQCFWQEVGAADAAGGLPPPPGSIPISPFAN